MRETCEQTRWHRRVQPLFRDCRLEARFSLPPTPCQAERAGPRAWTRTISLFSRPKTQAGGQGTPLKEREVGMGKKDLSSPLGDTPCPGPARRGRVGRPIGPKLRVASPARLRLPGTPRDPTPACVPSRTIIPNPHPTYLALGRCSRGAVPGAGWAHSGSTAGVGSAGARLLPRQTRKAAEAAPPPDLATRPRPPRASRPHARSDAGPAYSRPPLGPAAEPLCPTPPVPRWRCGTPRSRVSTSRVTWRQRRIIAYSHKPHFISPPAGRCIGSPSATTF